MNNGTLDILKFLALMLFFACFTFLLRNAQRKKEAGVDPEDCLKCIEYGTWTAFEKIAESLEKLYGKPVNDDGLNECLEDLEDQGYITRRERVISVNGRPCEISEFKKRWHASSGGPPKKKELCDKPA